MRFDAAIFDLDGTLLDSLQDIADSANHAIAELGFPTHSIDEYRYMVGDGVSVLFQRALPADLTDESIRKRCFEIYERTYSERWHNRSKPYDGIIELLTSLQNSGRRLAILSNKPDGFTQKCAAHFFPTVKFDIVLGHSPDFPRKPDPQSAKWIVSRMGVDASRTAYVGDTNTDMKTAVGATLYAIGVTWGFRPESELRESGAQAIVSNAKELEAALFD